MKNLTIKFITLITTICLSISVFAASDMDAFTVKVDGLGCPFCAYGLEKKFKEFDGIKAIKIDMETGIMNFNYPSESKLTIDAVEAKVEKAGYTPVKVEIDRADGSMETSVTTNTESSDDNLNQKAFEITVAGNCDMCKARIEHAAGKLSGVLNPSWNKDSKLLQFNANQNFDLKVLQQAVADAGHDTKAFKASNQRYNDLPGCCHYDRLN